MTARGRKRLFSALRIVICGVALWFVAWGVTFHDHVVLKEGSVELVGAVIEDGDPVAWLRWWPTAGSVRCRERLSRWTSAVIRAWGLG